MRSLGSKAVLVTLALWGLFAVVRADPDPLHDFAPGVTSFVLRDVFTNGVVSNGPGGVRAALNTTIFPALISQGITYVQFKMVPCGENLPHTHPRATELLTLISGGPLQAGFVDTTGTPHIWILNPGDIAIFPRGLLHFELNLGNTTAFYISALNSENPGVLSAAGSLLNLPSRALATAFNTTGEAVANLKNGIFQYNSELQMDMQSGCMPSQDISPNY